MRIESKKGSEMQELTSKSGSNVVLEVYEMKNGRKLIFEKIWGNFFQVRSGDSWAVGILASGYSKSYVKKRFKSFCFSDANSIVWVK